jgi:hypothetical protein
MASPMSTTPITGQAFTLAQKDTIDGWANARGLRVEVGRDSPRHRPVVQLVAAKGGLPVWTLWRCAWTGAVVADIGPEGAEVARGKVEDVLKAIAQRSQGGDALGSLPG